GSIRGWLYKILYRTFLNQSARRRRARAEVEFDSTAEASTGLSERPQHEMTLACRDIAAAMRALPHEQRAAIALTAVEGFSYDEAADVLGVPVGTLRSRLSRGREKLRELYIGSEDAPRLRQVK